MRKVEGSIDHLLLKGEVAVLDDDCGRLPFRGLDDGILPALPANRALRRLLHEANLAKLFDICAKSRVVGLPLLEQKGNRALGKQDRLAHNTQGKGKASLLCPIQVLCPLKRRIWEFNPDPRPRTWFDTCGPENLCHRFRILPERI